MLSAPPSSSLIGSDLTTWSGPRGPYPWDTGTIYSS